MQILIVEDDARMADALSAYLRREGYTTRQVGDGVSAVAAVGPDTEAVILDLGLPDMDGLDVCRRIRGISGVPILIATARSNVEARIKGLQAGADDFVVKPYDVRELIARIEAVTRRTRTAPITLVEQTAVEIDGVSIDLTARLIHADGLPVELTPKEFDILAVLSRYPGVTTPRDRIIREVWETDWSGFSRSLEVHVASIRRKLNRPDLIVTVRGVGYRLMGA
ncbi:response regulator transcription factor [Leucobacter coleopterorum]|uniref:Sensory transduction protein RegX3 n=1 Tax=Leucobacter coleopterorum TaxID=2714933 RepID=A0ABX6JWH3_9MICO|nr:response regulator transcription factor [Leucobacter coleopterorum]QIM18588.1 response regulator transcription factor [Leucobacter coleopterorum]